MSSGGMYAAGLAVDDLQYERAAYDGSRAYARTKRALVVLTELWGEQLRDSGVVFHAMHPGWADTPGVASSLPGTDATPAERQQLWDALARLTGWKEARSARR